VFVIVLFPILIAAKGDSLQSILGTEAEICATALHQHHAPPSCDGQPTSQQKHKIILQGPGGEIDGELFVLLWLLRLESVFDVIIHDLSQNAKKECSYGWRGVAGARKKEKEKREKEVLTVLGNGHTPPSVTAASTPKIAGGRPVANECLFTFETEQPT